MKQPITMLMRGVSVLQRCRAEQIIGPLVFMNTNYKWGPHKSGLCCFRTAALFPGEGGKGDKGPEGL